MGKIIDCVTFFDNNFMFDFRYNEINQFVDKFLICESLYDHKNNLKKINFDTQKKYINNPKVLHVLLEEKFPKNTNAWQNQALQREFVLKKLDFANEDDYIFFSDPDEIPNSKILENFKLKKKYGIFLQKFYNYKFNLFNPYETPWEGTRVCKMKNLKSIDFMREKVKRKNLRYKFFRLDKEKSIEIFDEGGWHFNNLMEPEEISKKLKTYAHTEYSNEIYSSPNIIREKIRNKIDLFDRGETYKKVNIDETFPKYLINNLNEFKNFIV